MLTTQPLLTAQCSAGSILPYRPTWMDSKVSTLFSQALRISRMAAEMLRHTSCQLICLPGGETGGQAHAQSCSPPCISPALRTGLSSYTSFISEELLRRATRDSTLVESGRKQGWSGLRILPSSGMQVSIQVSKKGTSSAGLDSDRITWKGTSSERTPYPASGPPPWGAHSWGQHCSHGASRPPSCSQAPHGSAGPGHAAQLAASCKGSRRGHKLGIPHAASSSQPCSTRGTLFLTKVLHICSAAAGQEKSLWAQTSSESPGHIRPGLPPARTPPLCSLGSPPPKFFILSLSTSAVFRYRFTSRHAQMLKRGKFSYNPSASS